jgi:hypothetical protein
VKRVESVGVAKLGGEVIDSLDLVSLVAPELTLLGLVRGHQLCDSSLRRREAMSA